MPFICQRYSGDWKSSIKSFKSYTLKGGKKRVKGKEENLGYKCELCYTSPDKPLLQTPVCLSLLTQVRVTRGGLSHQKQDLEYYHLSARDKNAKVIWLMAVIIHSNST